MNLFSNIFDQFTGQAQPQVPSFTTPQAPRTSSYVAPTYRQQTQTGMWVTTTQKPINTSLPMWIPEPNFPKDPAPELKAKFWFNDKDIEFLRLAKQKGYDSKSAFEYITKKKEQEKENIYKWQEFDPLTNTVWWVVAEIPKVAWETASFFSNLGAYTPWSVLSAAVRAPFVEETYWQLREQQKQWWEAFSKAWQTGKEFIQKYGAYDPNSTASKIWWVWTEIASTFLWPNKLKLLKEWGWIIAKYGAKALNLAQEGGVMWAKYDIASKWEITPEWVWYWAGGNVIFGGGLWLVKKTYEQVTKRLPASLTLGGLINPGKLDVVKKGLQMDEWIAVPEDVGKWILDRVKPWNKQEIAEQLIQHAEKTRWSVDEALASIPTYFKNPEAKKALMQIRSELEWKVWLEWRLSQIDEMLAKPEYTLSELNAVKRELDDMYNMYTKTGDPTAWLKAEWLRNVRSNLRGFIEKEADKFGVNVRKLNNETSTARGLAEWIMRKDSSEAVRELLTAFAPSGAGAVIWAWQAMVRWEDPLTVIRDALIGWIATKIWTSTTVRTNIANALNKLASKELTALESYIRSWGKDAIGKKVAEKVIKEGRALPSRTITKPSDFAKPQEKSIITPQTMEKWIIQESKQGISPNVKRPVTPQKKEVQKLLPAPRIPVWTSLPRTDVSAESMQGLSSNVKRPNGNINNTPNNPGNISVWNGIKPIVTPTVPKNTVNTPIAKKTATEVIKPKNSIYTSQEKAESYVKWHEKELQNPWISKKSITYLKKWLEDAKQEVELWKSLNKSNAKQQGIKPKSTTTNAFGEIIDKPSNKKGGFIKIPEIGKKSPVKNPLVEEAKKYKSAEEFIEKWFTYKPPKKVYRWIASEEELSKRAWWTAFASLWKWLYTTKDKSFAKKFWKIEELDSTIAFPRNPLVIERPFWPAVWALKDWMLNKTWLKTIAEFHKKYWEDYSTYLQSLWYDGAVIWDEIVKYWGKKTDLQIKDELRNIWANSK